MAGSGQFTGQRAQKPHLVRGTGGLQGEIADLREDIKRDFASNAAIAVEEWLAPGVVDPDAIVLSFATVASPLVISGAGLDGAIGAGAISPPRTITVSTAGVTPADAPATVDIVGTDIDGNVLSETLALAQTAATATSIKAYASITSLTFPAADGTAALLEVGIGGGIGLSEPSLSRAGAGAVILEIEDGARVTTGDIDDAAAAPPYGIYNPATPPNGVIGYALFYEYDASQNT